MDELRQIRAAVRAARSESAEKAAVARALAQLGHHRMPEVHQYRARDGVCRCYIWRSTPLGHVCLCTGPGVEAEVTLVVECGPGSGVEIGDIYIPGRGNLPPLCKPKHPHANPTISSKKPITREDYPGVFGDAGHGVPAVDDPWPGRLGCPPGAAKCPDTVEEVRLSDEVGKLVDLREEFVEALGEVRSALSKIAGPSATVKGRVKTPFSVINKLVRKRLLGPKGLTDVAGAAVVCRDRQAVDHVVAGIHKKFQVVDFEDFYKTPLAGYRAIHLVVRLGDGKLVEIQVKTDRMDAISHGSHTPYKQGTLDSNEMSRLTALAAAADEGNSRAAREIDAILAGGEAALEERLTLAETFDNPRGNPAKMPKIKFPSAHDFEKEQPTYFGTLIHAVTAKAPDKAMRLAMFRAFLDAFGVKPLQLTVGKTYLSDVDVGHFWVSDGDILKLLGLHYSPASHYGKGTSLPALRLHSYDFGKTTPDTSQHEVDYFDATPYTVPGDYVGLARAVIAATAKVNGLPLSSAGEATLLSLPKATTPKQGATGPSGGVMIDFSPAEGVTVSGDTYPVKGLIKEAGFHWSGKQKQWYFPGSTTGISPKASAAVQTLVGSLVGANVAYGVTDAYSAAVGAAMGVGTAPSAPPPAVSTPPATSLQDLAYAVATKLEDAGAQAVHADEGSYGDKWAVFFEASDGKVFVIRLDDSGSGPIGWKLTDHGPYQLITYISYSHVGPEDPATEIVEKSLKSLSAHGLSMPKPALDEDEDTSSEPAPGENVGMGFLAKAEFGNVVWHKAPTSAGFRAYLRTSYGWKEMQPNGDLDSVITPEQVANNSGQQSPDGLIFWGVESAVTSPSLRVALYTQIAAVAMPAPAAVPPLVPVVAPAPPAASPWTPGQKLSYDDLESLPVGSAIVADDIVNFKAKKGDQPWAGLDDLLDGTAVDWFSAGELSKPLILLYLGSGVYEPGIAAKVAELLESKSIDELISELKPTAAPAPVPAAPAAGLYTPSIGDVIDTEEKVATLPIGSMAVNEAPGSEETFWHKIATDEWSEQNPDSGIAIHGSKVSDYALASTFTTLLYIGDGEITHTSEKKAIIAKYLAALAQLTLPEFGILSTIESLYALPAGSIVYDADVQGYLIKMRNGTFRVLAPSGGVDESLAQFVAGALIGAKLIATGQGYHPSPIVVKEMLVKVGVIKGIDSPVPSPSAAPGVDIPGAAVPPVGTVLPKTTGDPDPPPAAPPALVPVALQPHPAWAQGGGAASIGLRLKKIGGSLGTQQGGTYQDQQTGQKFYVKFPQSVQHIANEVFADWIYRALGVHAPDARLAVVDGKSAILWPWLEGYSGAKGKWMAEEKDYLAREFVADAWLANYDVVGAGPEHPQQNLLRWSGEVTLSGPAHPQNPYHYLRVDNGSAMLYSGTGKTKPFPSNNVAELVSMLDPSVNPTAASVFSRARQKPQLAAQMLRRIDFLIYSLWKKAAVWSGFHVSSAVPLADVLVARRNSMNVWAKNHGFAMDSEITPLSGTVSAAPAPVIGYKPPTEANLTPGQPPPSIDDLGKFGVHVPTGTVITLRDYAQTLYMHNEEWYLLKRDGTLSDTGTWTPAEIVGSVDGLEGLIVSEIGSDKFEKPGIAKWKTAYHYKSAKGKAAVEAGTEAVAGETGPQVPGTVVTSVEQLEAALTGTVIFYKNNVDPASVVMKAGGTWDPIQPDGSIQDLSVESSGLWTVGSGPLGPLRFLRHGKGDHDTSVFSKATRAKWYMAAVAILSGEVLPAKLSAELSQVGAAPPPAAPPSAPPSKPKPAAPPLPVVPVDLIPLGTLLGYHPPETLAEIQGRTKASEFATSTGTWEWGTYSGDRWLAISGLKTPAHAKAVYAALRLYNGLGVRAAVPALLDGGSNVAMRVPAGWIPLTAETKGSLEKHLPSMAQEFPADAWIANWSVLGHKAGIYSMIFVSPDGSNYLRIGGLAVLDRRWGGETKATWGSDQVAELKSLLDSSGNESAAWAFQQAQDQHGRLSELTAEMLGRVTGAGPGLAVAVDAEAGTAYAPTLQGRAAVLSTALEQEIAQATAHITAAAAPVQAKKAKKGPLVGAGALITDGQRILLIKRSGLHSEEPYTWVIPGGALDEGEDVVEAAKREAKEELGHLPEGLKWSGITLTAQYPEKKLTFYTAVFFVSKSAAQSFKPFSTGKFDHAAAAEVEGWAWVHLDELRIDQDESGNRVSVWTPKLHYGMAVPVSYTTDAGKADIASVVTIWAENVDKWKAALKGTQLESVLGFDLEKYGDKGLPFLGDLYKNPRGRRTGRGAIFDFIPRRRGHPHVRVSVTPTEPTAAERRALLSGGGILTGESDESRTARYVTALRIVLGIERPTVGDLQKAATLDLIGLPLERAVPGAARAVARANPMNPAFAASPVPLPAKGTLTITHKQLASIEEVYQATVKLLGEKPSPSTGAAKQQELKAKIQHAISATKGPTVDTEETAKWLRYLAVARAVGLWSEILDPGRRIVYRGLSISTVSPSFLPTADTKAQMQAIYDAGLAPPGKFDLMPMIGLWLRCQSGQQGPVGFVRTAAGWTPVPAKTLQPPPGKDPQPWDTPYGKVVSPPSWAAEPWANVAGLRFEYAHWKYKVSGVPQLVSHWSAEYIGGFGQSQFLLRTTADADRGFILLPTKTLTSTSYENEREVIHVDLGEMNPTPVEAVKIHSSSYGGELTIAQLNAYHGARPAYPPGYSSTESIESAYEAATEAAAKKNPRGGGQWPASYPGMRVQSLIFDRDRFTAAAARRWAREHDFVDSKVDEALNSWRLRQSSPAAFRPGTFRTIRFTDGVQAVVAVPREAAAN